jgi:hypothetical protein
MNESFNQGLIRPQVIPNDRQDRIQLLLGFLSGFTSWFPWANFWPKQIIFFFFLP